jgi:hypothetical protein
MEYSFTRAEVNHAKKLIPVLKDYIYNSTDFDGEMPVAEFFDQFLKLLPKWWKENSYSFSSITRNFNTILVQVLRNKKQRIKYNGQQGNEHKPTVEDVFATINRGGQEQG